jgi:phosphonate transport system substrate-binding protein
VKQYPSLSALRRMIAAILTIGCALILNGCLSATPTITPGPIQTATPTPLPTPTATPMPLGSPENPFVLGLVQTQPELSLDGPAQNLADLLATATQKAVAARVFAGYKELLESMTDGGTHIAFLPPLTYLYASQRGLAEVALLTNHFGVFGYGTQFMANAEDNYTIYYDPLSGQNSAGPEVALQQFAGKRPCWVDPESTAGYIVPAGLLLENQVETGTAAFSQSHTAVVRSLYVKGVCDFGATFSLTGDPRTASNVLADLPDAGERIPIIWRSEAVIPNLNISYLAGLSEETRNAFNSAFLALADGADGRAALSAAAGDYSIEALKVESDTRYDPLRGYVEALDLELSTLIGK